MYNVDIKDITLIFDGENLSDDDTFTDLDMESDDMVDVKVLLINIYIYNNYNQYIVINEVYINSYYLTLVYEYFLILYNYIYYHSYNNLFEIYFLLFSI